MTKDKLKITKIPGGLDPVKIIQDFIITTGFDKSEAEYKQKEDSFRWQAAINEQVNLEIFLENNDSPTTSIVYLGINIANIPIKKTQDFLVTALENADMLFDAKISIVNDALVMSSTLLVADISTNLLTEKFKAIKEQSDWLRKVVTGE